MYGVLDYIKRISFVFLHIILFVYICQFAYAGNLVEIDGFMMYKTKNGEFAKDCFIWLDINGDSVKECYRFNEKGYIAKNYIGHDNRRTNDKGQLIENGLVVKKLKSGLIIKNDGTLQINEKENNIVNNIDNNVKQSNSIEEIKKDNNIILTTKIKNDKIKTTPIGNDKTENSKIIYSNNETKNDNNKNDDESSKSNIQIVAGKNIKNYITEKHNAKIDVEKVIIFGNDSWEEAIELRGNNASIKVNIKNFNYIYFEVAEEHHVVDVENDENIRLDVYVDGKLYDTLDEFVENNPQIEEIEELDGKNLELKVRIDGKNKYRKVYIRNGRLKKIREKDE